MRFWRLRSKSPGRIALRAICPGQGALSIEFPDPSYSVIGTRQRREKGDQVVDFVFRQGQRLHVLVEPRILKAVAFIVMIHDVPEGLLRTVVKIRPRYQHVPQIRRLERSNIGFLLGNEEPTERGQFGSDGGAIDGRRVA